MAARIKNIFRQISPGILISILAIVSFVILLNSAYQIALAGHNQCSLQYLGCTVIGHFPVESFFGLGALAVIAVLGIFMDKKKRVMSESLIKTSEKTKNIINKLGTDERKIYDIIVAADGTIFQNEIIEKSGLSKVKTSRLLDKLEINGIVERRRRGMANLIVLKQK